MPVSSLTRSLARSRRLTRTLALARLLAHLHARPHAPSASTLARARFGANALQRTGTLTAAHPLARSHASPPARSLASSLAGPLEPRAPTSSLALSLARALVASAFATAVPTPERWWRRAMRVLFSAPVNDRPRISRGQGSAGGRLTLPPCARASGACGGRMCLRYRRAALGQAATAVSCAIALRRRCGGGRQQTCARARQRAVAACHGRMSVPSSLHCLCRRSMRNQRLVHSRARVGIGSSVRAAARPRVYFRDGSAFVGECGNCGGVAEWTLFDTTA